MNRSSPGVNRLRIGSIGCSAAGRLAGAGAPAARRGPPSWWMLLRAAGADPVAVPLISIEPPADPGLLDLRLVDLARGEFAWVGFTSANAVDAVLARAEQLGLLPRGTGGHQGRGRRSGHRRRAAGRGSAGRPACHRPAARPTRWPPSGRTRSGDAAVLLPRSDLAAPVLPHALAAMGYRVDAVTAYRTVVQPVPAAVAAELSAGGVRRRAVHLAEHGAGAAAGGRFPPSTMLCAIGRPTTAAAAAAGRPVARDAPPHPTARAPGRRHWSMLCRPTIPAT